MTPPVTTAAGGAGTTASLHVHATWRGRGRVYDGDRLVAAVMYVAIDVEERVDLGPRGAAPAVARPGERNVYGRFELPDARVFAGYVGVRLALRLEDERQLPFTVTRLVGPRSVLINGLGPIA